MGGGLMQLVAYGAQDVYLTGNPQITFFKVVYRRHTNFSMESIEQTFNGTAGFGRKVTCTVSRNGDLIHRVYLQVTTPAVTASTSSFRWLNWLGHVLVKNVEVEIGGQRIDKHYGDWLHPSAPRDYLLSLCQTLPDALIRRTEVGDYVNSARNEGPECETPGPTQGTLL